MYKSIQKQVEIIKIIIGPESKRSQMKCFSFGYKYITPKLKAIKKEKVTINANKLPDSLKDLIKDLTK